MIMGGSIPSGRRRREIRWLPATSSRVADLARQFKNAKATRVEEILDTLVALGHARRTAAGYASA